MTVALSPQQLVRKKPYPSGSVVMQPRLPAGDRCSEPLYQGSRPDDDPPCRRRNSLSCLRVATPFCPTTAFPISRVLFWTSPSSLGCLAPARRPCRGLCSTQMRTRSYIQDPCLEGSVPSHPGKPSRLFEPGCGLSARTRKCLHPFFASHSTNLSLFHLSSFSEEILPRMLSPRNRNHYNACRSLSAMSPPSPPAYETARFLCTPPITYRPPWRT